MSYSHCSTSVKNYTHTHTHTHTATYHIQPVHLWLTAWFRGYDVGLADGLSLIRARKAGKLSAVGQTTRQTQPSIHLGSVNESM